MWNGPAAYGHATATRIRDTRTPGPQERGDDLNALPAGRPALDGLMRAVGSPASLTDEPPMSRVSVPEADRLIGVKHPVLSHGFVALVDYMGNDAAIVQAARVSYGQGTKSVRDDRGLIRYLMRHRHTTPFEMVEYKFLIRLPIFVARQWIRHRTACLSEGTKVVFDLPGGARRGHWRAYPIAVEELWRKFQDPPDRNPGSLRAKARVRKMWLRQLNEETGVLGHTRLVGIVKSGVKPVFRMTLADGKEIECTADHRFLFDDGWHSLAERTGLRELGGRAIWEAGDFRLTVNGQTVEIPASYQDREWLYDQYVNRKIAVPDIAHACGVNPSTIAAWIRRFSIPTRGPRPSPFTTGNSLYRLRRNMSGVPKPRSQRPGTVPLYRSKSWLENRWVAEGRSAGEIANECRVRSGTIRKWLWIHHLTNHPDHSSNKAFERGHLPWNRGLTYRLGPRSISATHLATIRRARAGSASNFWKGGVSSERAGIGRWTSQIAPTIHQRNNWTCQLCFRKRSKLHAHHIVPVWADPTLARHPENLTTLCEDCHKEVHKDERAYVERLGGPRTDQLWIRPTRVAWNRLTIGRYESIKNFEFVGERETYDLEVEGPHHNFVANGIVTHNSVNEYSARYSVVPDQFELPKPEDIRSQSERNRQGRGAPAPPRVVERFLADVAGISQSAYAAYNRALEDGIARETARLVLPLSYYTEWYWKINLHNLLHFLSLRLDPHAQEEIRLYAAEVAKIARAVCPVAFEAFDDFQIEGLLLSKKERTALRHLLEGESVAEACAAAGLPLLREDGKPMKSGEGIEFLEKLEQIKQVGA
jgi:thymidylate synthase (FAD)